MGWDGVGLDGMGWIGLWMEWDFMGWDGIRWAGNGNEMGWRCDEIRWDGIDRDGMELNRR